MLAVVTGRERAYSQRYAGRFLARLAHAGAAESLTKGVAKWTWQLWQTGQPSAEQPTPPPIFSIDGHRKAVYSDVLVPRGKVGQARRKNLRLPRIGRVTRCAGTSTPGLNASRRLPLDDGFARDAALRIAQAIDLPLLMRRVVVDREGMAAAFLAQLTLEGRQVVTLLKADQYKDEQSFQQVGEWQPWRFNRQGQMICEVAAARFADVRPTEGASPLEVEVAASP
jgi:hypothetical protein